MTLTHGELLTARSYHAHHFTCKACAAAGRGVGVRCGLGGLLWMAYQALVEDAGATLAQAKRDSGATAALLTPPDGNHGGNISGELIRG